MIYTQALLFDTIAAVYGVRWYIADGTFLCAQRYNLVQRDFAKFCPMDLYVDIVVEPEGMQTLINHKFWALLPENIFFHCRGDVEPAYKLKDPNSCYRQIEKNWIKHIFHPKGGTIETNMVQVDIFIAYPKRSPKFFDDYYDAKNRSHTFSKFPDCKEFSKQSCDYGFAREFGTNVVKFYNMWEFPIPVHDDEYLKAIYGGKKALKVPRFMGFETAPNMFHEVADPFNLPGLLRPYEACKENKRWCPLFKEAELLSEQRKLKNICPLSNHSSLRKCKWQRVDFTNPLTLQGGDEFVFKSTKSSTKVFNDLKSAQLQCECIKSQRGDCGGVIRRRQEPNERGNGELLLNIFYGCGVSYWKYHLVTSEKFDLQKLLHERVRKNEAAQSYQTGDVKLQEQTTNRVWLYF